MIIAALIFSSLGQPLIPSPAAASSVAISAGSVTTYGPLTNRGVVFGSNALSGAVFGSQYAINWPTGTVDGVNLAPTVCGYQGGQTTWITNGTGRFAGHVLTAGGLVGVTLAFPIGTNSGDGYTRTFSNYVAGTLGHHCLTNVTARTNAGKTGALFSGGSAAGWVWNTNSMIYGVEGYSGLSLTTGAWHWAAITKRHVYTAAHIYGTGEATNSPNNFTLLFVGTDGATNSVQVTSSRRRSIFGAQYDDYTLGHLSADLPATVQPLAVVWSSNVFSKMPVMEASNPRALLETCQHGRVGSQGMTLFDNHAMHVAGDSGNPAFVIVSNKLVTYQGTSGTLLSSNFLADLAALTVGAGLATNDYWPVIESLSAFPDL